MASTLIASRLTEAHRLAQVRLGAQTIVEMHAIWPLLDPTDLDGTFARWLRAATPVVGRNRAVSARVAANYLKTFRALELPDAAPMVPTIAEVVSTKQLATSLLVTGPISIKQAMLRSVPLARAVDTAQSASSASAMRFAMNGGRETIVETSKADKEARGWTWVASGGKTCDYCASLDGTLFYQGESKFEPHDKCACNAEPTY